MKKGFFIALLIIAFVVILFYCIFKFEFIKIEFTPDSTYLCSITNLTKQTISGLSIIVKDSNGFEKSPVLVEKLNPTEKKEVSISTADMDTQAGYIWLRYKNAAGANKEINIVDYFVVDSSGLVNIDIVSIDENGNLAIESQAN